MPAWFWVALFVFVAINAVVIGPPEKLPEPPEAATVFPPFIFVTRSGNSFQFVQVKGHERFAPLWRIDLQSHETVRDPLLFGWYDGRFRPGIYRRSSTWRYSLTSLRVDKDESSELTTADMEKLRPLLIAELERRSPAGQQYGTRLEKLLDSGLEHSTYVCGQNVVILLAWLTLVPAVIAVGAMFTAASKFD